MTMHLQFWSDLGWRARVNNECSTQQQQKQKLPASITVPILTICGILSFTLGVSNFI